MWSNIMNTAQTYANAAAENVKQGVQATQKYLEQMDEDMSYDPDDEQKLPAEAGVGQEGIFKSEAQLSQPADEEVRTRAPVLEKRQSSGDGWGDEQEDELDFSDDNNEDGEQSEGHFEEPAVAQHQQEQEEEGEEEEEADVQVEGAQEADVQVEVEEEEDVQVEGAQDEDVQAEVEEDDEENKLEEHLQISEQTDVHAEEGGAEPEQVEEFSEPRTPLQKKEMEMAQLETDYDKRIQQLLELLERTRAHGEEKASEAQNLSKQLQKLQAQLHDAQDTVAQQEHLQSELVEKEQDLETLRQTLNQVQQEYRRAETMRVEQVKMYDALVQEIQTKEATHADLQQRFETVQTQEASAAAELQALAQQLQSSQQELDKSQHENEDLLGRLQSLEAQAQANAMSMQVPSQEDSGVQVAAEEFVAATTKDSELLADLRAQLEVAMQDASALKELHVGLADEVYHDIDQCKQALESQLEVVLTMHRGELERCKAGVLGEMVPNEPTFDIHRAKISAASTFSGVLAAVAGVAQAIQEEAATQIAAAQAVGDKNDAEFFQRNELQLLRINELETIQHDLQQRIDEMQAAKEHEKEQLSSVNNNLNVKMSELWEENLRLKATVAESAHRLQSVAEFEIQLGTKTNELAAASRQLMALEDDRAALARERDQLTDANAILEQEKDTVNAKAQELTESYKQAMSELEALKLSLTSEVSRAEEAAALADAREAELASVRSDYDQSRATIEQLRHAQNSAESLQQEIDKLVAKKQKDLEELKRLNQRIMEIQRGAAEEKSTLQEQLAHLHDELSGAQLELTTAQTALADLRAENEQLSSQIDMLQSAASSTRSETDDEQFIIIRDNYERETSKSAELQQEVELLRTQLQQIQTDHQRHEDAAVANESMKTDLLRQLEDRERNAKQLNEQIKSLRSEMEMQKLTNAQLKKEIMDANSASVAKAWQRNPTTRLDEPAIIGATDVEGGRLGDLDESEKKNSSQQVIARIWGTIRSRCPDQIAQAMGDKPPSQATLNTALVVYIVLLHLLLISAWAR